MITRNIYDIPYPETTPADMDELKVFFDNTLLPFLAEKLGMVVRSDLAVMAPDYAPNSYVTFLAPSANANPILAVWNSNYNNYRYIVFAISSVTKVENVFRPNVSSNGMVVNSTFQYMGRWNASIVLQSYAFNNYKSSLVVIDMGDGRKIASFRTIQISSGSIFNVGGQSSIYFGNIKMNGDIVNTCVVMSAGFNTPWLEHYEQCASSSVITSAPNISSGNYAGLLGLVYSNAVGKQYLINFELCIGEDAYIPNCLWYSDCLKGLSAGSILRINDKRYVCIWPSSDNGFRLIIPEEVS